MYFATTLLPVPLSPRIKIDVGVDATLSAISKVFCITGSFVTKSASGIEEETRASNSATRPRNFRFLVIRKHLPDLIERERFRQIICGAGANGFNSRFK